jgi:transposase
VRAKRRYGGMDYYISFDSHKRYTVAAVEGKETRTKVSYRIEHKRGQVKEFLSEYGSGGHVAVETIGKWYWIVDEIEDAGKTPLLVHAQKSKVMMGMINKTDKLDAEGLNRLQRTGTLPTVWIPPQDLRDKRELYRQRMQYVQERTRIKNRLHANLAKYGYSGGEFTDLFDKKGRAKLKKLISELPPNTQEMSLGLLEHLETLAASIEVCEQAMAREFADNPTLKLLKTIPGVGFILGTIILNETGDINRFPSASQFTSYCGTTPRVKASGGKVRYGRLRKDCNHYLKWAFVEAANVSCLKQSSWKERHTLNLYRKIRGKRGHGVAIGAVARHLSEAAYWIMKKQEPYKDPAMSVVSRQG